LAAVSRACPQTILWRDAAAIGPLSKEVGAP